MPDPASPPIRMSGVRRGSAARLEQPAQRRTPSPDWLARETRAVFNQSLFREINERVKELNEGFSMVLPVGEWICECADDTCVERIEMSAEEYEAIRRDGARFFVAPTEEHIRADSQRIVERHSRYWVVEKTGEPREVAKRADPRANDDGPLPLRT